MTNDDAQVSVDSEQAWQILVDSQLSEIWSTAEYWDLTSAEAEAMTEVVLLRLLEWTEGRRALAPNSPSVTTIVRAIAMAEAERMRRRSLWRAATSERVIDLTALEATPRGARP